MANYNKLHKLWHRAHISGSPTKFVRNSVIFSELNNIKPGNTLDVGCGTGEYSVFLAQHGHIVTAFDPSSHAIKVLRENINSLRIKADVNTFEGFQATELFDNIISIEVMEHIELDRVFAKKLYSLLKPGGTLVISVPATQLLYSEADKISGHYRRYSYKQFSKILTDAGFINFKIKRYGFPVLLIYSIFRKCFLDKILIRYFSFSASRPSNKFTFISKFSPFLLKIDQYDKPLWSVGYVARCRK
jgi:SAM-dependent methyltransferase